MILNGEMRFRRGVTGGRGGTGKTKPSVSWAAAYWAPASRKNEPSAGGALTSAWIVGDGDLDGRMCKFLSGRRLRHCKRGELENSPLKLDNETKMPNPFVRKALTKGFYVRGAESAR